MNVPSLTNYKKHNIPAPFYSVNGKDYYADVCQVGRKAGIADTTREQEWFIWFTFVRGQGRTFVVDAAAAGIVLGHSIVIDSTQYTIQALQVRGRNKKGILILSQN